MEEPSISETRETPRKANTQKDGKVRRGRRKPLKLEPSAGDGRRTATVTGLDVSEKHIQICEIDVDDVVSGGRIATSDKEAPRVLRRKGSSTDRNRDEFPYPVVH